MKKIINFRLFQARPDVQKVDVNNDRMMVDECLRQPQALVFDFKKTPEEKAMLATQKANYRKLKKNLVAFKETLEYIIKEFVSRPMPNWGSFIFN